MTGWYRRFGATSRFYVRQTTTQTSHCNDLHQTSPCSLLCFVSGKSRVQVPTGTQTTLTTLVPLTQHNTIQLGHTASLLTPQIPRHKSDSSVSTVTRQSWFDCRRREKTLLLETFRQGLGLPSGQQTGHLDHLPRGLSSQSLKLHNHLHVIRYDTPRITTCTTQSFFMAQKTALSQLNP